MKDKFTPGPWFAESADMFGDHNIVTGDQIDRLAVAAVVSNMRPTETVEANAHLIAAAPEMLAILESIARPFPDGCNWEDQARACQVIAEQIVAKARGNPA